MLRRKAIERRRLHRARPSVLSLEERLVLSTFTVTNTLDDGSSGSLRWAIGQANANPGADTIGFDSSFATPKTIALSGTQLQLTDSALTTISGPGANLLTVSGANASRVMRVAASAQASISGMKITGGQVSGSGASGSGGGLANFGTTTLSDAIVTGNRSASFRGGALYNNAGSLTLNNCTVSGSPSNSGGILNVAGALTLGNSTVSGNTGRGVDNSSGSLTMTNCAVTGNGSTNVLVRGGTATLTNITVGGASTGILLTGGNTALTNDTIVGNNTGLINNSSTALATVQNTIVTSNGFTSMSGAVVSLGHNLVGSASDPSGWVGSDQVGTPEQPIDPLLAPLGGYGGSTQTFALLPGSPAIDAGAAGAGVPATDQRGAARVGGADIGAFESSGFTIAYVSGSGQSASGEFSDPLVAAVAAVNPIEPTVGGRVTFAPPVAGASAVLTGNPAVVAGDGTASVAAASNFIGGDYLVSATAAGAPGAASFSLTNHGLVSIAVTPGDPTLALGVSGQFFAEGTFSDAETHDVTRVVTWKSATPSVAPIGVSGYATGVSLGTSVVTASLDGVTSPDQTLSVVAPGAVVDTVDDDFGFFAGTTSLREAIAGANLVPGTTITFDASVFSVPSTITLSLGQLELTNTAGALSIVGPAGGVTVDGGGTGRVFEIAPDVTASISGLTITGGVADDDYGGGLLSFGTITLTNCTIAGNSGWGGGLVTGTQDLPVGTTALINCTVTGNFGGGVDSNFGTTSLTNTIVSGQSSGYDIYGPVTGSHNLVGRGSGGLIDGVDGNIVGVTNPLLSPLGIHGGSSLSAAVLPGSRAIGAGTAGVGVPSTDERGVIRTGAIDIGAFQTSGFTMTIGDGSTPQSADIGTLFAAPLAVFVSANNPDDPVDGGVVDFAAGRVDGATAILLASAVVIDGGWASTIGGPNNALGTYGLVASAAGTLPVTFELTNTGTLLSQLVVNTTSDDLIAGPGLMSLREAVLFINYDTIGISSISFDETVFADPTTIFLTGTQLELSNTSATYTIAGPSAGVTIDAQQWSRVFQIDAGVSAILSDMTITGGMADGDGGGLLNMGDATLTRVAILRNTAASGGGGVYNSGGLTLTSSTIADNRADGADGGGGLNNQGTVSLTDCTVSGNASYGSGGGIQNSGLLTLTGSTIDGNSTFFYAFWYQTGSGGGLNNDGTATLTGCTISGNATSAQSRLAGGGGVHTSGGATTTLKDCVVSGNAARGNSASGGGVSVESGGTAFLIGCDVESNSARYYGAGVADWGAITISGGTIRTNSLASRFSGGGGGISVGGVFDNYDAHATVTDCLIADNTAPLVAGGGVANWGEITLLRCTITGNTAQNAGGVFSSAAANGGSLPASVTLVDSSIVGNHATGAGGGALSGGTALITGDFVQAYSGSLFLNNCTVSGNTADDRGGAVFVGGLGHFSAVNSTITGNSALKGGAAYTVGTNFGYDIISTTDLTNCTVSGNSASDYGGGLVNGPRAVTTPGNTIVAGNTAGTSSPDVAGTFVSDGNNLIGETDGSSGWVGSDLTGTVASPLVALLAPLDDYGGLTKTMPLLPGSPAIDAGSSLEAPEFDQRGLPRVGGVDIGAFESQGFTLARLAGSSPQSTVAGTAFGNPLAVRITADNPVEPVDGGVIRFTSNAGGSGASSTLSAGWATIADSLAAVAATANGIVGASTVSATAAGVVDAALFSLLNQAAVSATSVRWGTVGNALLFTAGDGLRLLPAGRNVSLPWLNIQRIGITLNAATPLTAADVSVTGISIADYGPVIVTGSGTDYVITLARPIAAADRLTVTIRGALISNYTRRIDVLPGDVNDDGSVDATDLALERNYYLNGIPNIFAEIVGNGTPSLVDYNAVRAKANTKLPKLK